MLWNESSMLISLLGTKVLGDESSRERKFQGTKVPPIELSFPGTKVLGYESSSYPSNVHVIELELTVSTVYNTDC